MKLVTEAKQETANLRSELGDMTEAVDEAKTRAMEASQEVTELQSALRSQETEQSKLKQQFDASEMDNERHSAEIAALKSECKVSVGEGEVKVGWKC